MSSDSSARNTTPIVSSTLRRSPDLKLTWQHLLVGVIGKMSRDLRGMQRDRAMRRADWLGRAAYLVAAKPRRIALRNFRLTQFPRPDATPAERDALTRSVFRHFARSVVDFVWMQSRSTEEVENLIDPSGMEHVYAALARGKGAVMVTAHLGNWELLGRYLAQHGVPLTVVGRDPDNPEFSAMVRRMRENGGVSVASKGGSARELLGVLRRNGAIGLLPDQNSGDLFAPFFGIPAGTVAGPATLALHAGAALLAGYCVRTPEDRYRVIMLPEIDVHATGDRESDQLSIMSEVNRKLEAMIREYPDQWLWLHNRWKSAFEDKNRDRAWGTGTETTANVASAAFTVASRRWNELNL